MSIVNSDTWSIETADITELEVVKVAVGQKVRFTVDALKDVTTNGVVYEICRASYVQVGDVVYRDRISVYDVDPCVKWGMTVEMIFEPVE